VLDLTDLDKMLEMAGEEEPTGDLEEADVEVELELVDDVSQEGSEPVEEVTEDLDFSDIEKLLEMDEEALADGDAADEKESELELELEMESDLEISRVDKAETGVDELDLSDIEKLLEMDDLKVPQAESDEEELKLELDLETGDESASEDTFLEMDNGNLKLDDKDLKDLELELGASDDFALEMDKDYTTAVQSSEKEDIGLKFDVEEPDPGGTAVDIRIGDEAVEPEEIKSGSFGMGVEKEPEESLKPAAQVKSKTELPFTASMPLPEKNLKAPVITILLLLLLAVGAVGGYYYGVEKGIKMPFFGSHGEIIPLEESFKHAFVENDKIGGLFVITGLVENKFKEARSSIQVSGELLTSDARVVQKQTVYCGNMINETELARVDRETIKKRLENPSGDNNSNINAKSGFKLPFMLVFSDLPENMAEYRIQIAGSSPVEK
jgi:hypothetical protein